MASEARFRVLITGGGGFVAPHVARALRQQLGSSANICLAARNAMDREGLRLGDIDDTCVLDVTDAEAAIAVVGSFKPTHIVHLAAIAAIDAATAHAAQAWQVNLHGTLAVANAVLAAAPGCVLVNVGSGQVYGASALTTPALDERALLCPSNTYEATKAAADLAVGAMVSRGLRCVRLRPFNHTGPGQSEAFVAPSFAMQVARIERGLQEPVIKVGNLEAERDFLDVRDVARAYASAVARSDQMANNLVLNIASGVPTRVRALLDRLLAQSTTSSIRVQQDPQRNRVSDIPRYVGNADAARKALAWSPEVDLDETLSDLLDDCRARVARA